MKGPGRPRIPKKHKRSEFVSLRVTLSEHKALRLLGAGQPAKGLRALLEKYMLRRKG